MPSRSQRSNGSARFCGRLSRPLKLSILSVRLANHSGQSPTFTSWKRLLALELHHGLEASYERATSLDALALWRRRVAIDCLGTPAFGLPLPDELVALSAHAGKPFHGFSRLLWIADLGMVVGHCIETGGEVDWPQVRPVAEEGRCTNVVAVALGLAGHAGVEVPRELLPLPERGWRSVALRRLPDISWPLGISDAPPFHLRYALTEAG